MKKGIDLGFAKGLHKNPDLILEAAYSNPLVRRWHKKRAMNDPSIQHWKKTVLSAGSDDAETLLRAFNSELIGFTPGNYRWERRNGIYIPGDENVDVPDGVAEWAKGVYGDDSPGTIVNKLLGVTRPGQIALRTAGTAAPVLHPKVAHISFSDFDHADNESVISARIKVDFAPVADNRSRGHAEYVFGFHEDGSPSETMYLDGLFLPSSMLGNGFGLAAYSSLQAWSDSLGFDGVSLTAADVGRYVWPKLGFDGHQWEDVVEDLGKAVYGLDPDSFEGEEQAKDTVYEETLGKGLPGIADYTWGDYKVGRNALLGQPDLEDLVKWNNENDRIDAAAEERVRRLEGGV